LQEIADNPEFFVGDATRFDVQQGELGEYSYAEIMVCKSV
jgi:hypothetical protein